MLSDLRHFGDALQSTYGWKSPIERTKNNEPSAVLWLVALLMFVIRLTWLSQFLKLVLRTLKTPDQEIPPLVAELYLLTSLAIDFATILANQFDATFFAISADLIAFVCIWKIFESITNNVYYLLLRPILELKAPHSPARSFIMASLALAEVWLLLCLIWYFVGTTEPALDSISAAIYFTSTTFFTVGYGDIVPKGTVSRLLAVFTMFTATIMFAVVLSRALSLVRPLPPASEYP